MSIKLKHGAYFLKEAVRAQRCPPVAISPAISVAVRLSDIFCDQIVTLSIVDSRVFETRVLRSLGPLAQDDYLV